MPKFGNSKQKFNNSSCSQIPFYLENLCVNIMSKKIKREIRLKQWERSTLKCAVIKSYLHLDQCGPEGSISDTGGSGFSPSMKAQRTQRFQQITRSLQSAGLQAQDSRLRTGQHQCCCSVCTLSAK